MMPSTLNWLMNDMYACGCIEQVSSDGLEEDLPPTWTRTSPIICSSEENIICEPAKRDDTVGVGYFGTCDNQRCCTWCLALSEERQKAIKSLRTKSTTLRTETLSCSSDRQQPDRDDDTDDNESY